MWARTRGIAITPDGKTLYVVNWAHRSRLGDTDRHGHQHRTEADPGARLPLSIAISPDGRSVYVGSFKRGTVTMISTATNHVRAGAVMPPVAPS